MCLWYWIDGYWCLAHYKLIRRSYNMLDNMYIDALGCQGAFHSMQFLYIDRKE